MLGYSPTIWLVHALTVVTLVLIAVACKLGLWRRRKAPPQFVWPAVLSAWMGIIFWIVSQFVGCFSIQGSQVFEHLDSNLNRPASTLIGWMAYRGRGFIDTPLTVDGDLVPELGAAMLFWTSFTAIVLFKATRRKRVTPVTA